MNPLFQALQGASGLGQMSAAQSSMQMPGGPFGAFQNVIQRAQQLANQFRNPQQMVKQFFPDAPDEISGNPEQLLGWMQQTGKVNPQMVQMVRQLAGR